MSDEADAKAREELIEAVRQDCNDYMDAEFLARYRAVLPRTFPLPNDPDFLRPPTGYYRERLSPAPPRRRMMACQVSIREAAELCGRTISNNVLEVCRRHEQRDWCKYDADPWMRFEEMSHYTEVDQPVPAEILDRVLTWQMGSFESDINAKCYTGERWWEGFDIESGDPVVMIRATKEAS